MRDMRLQFVIIGVCAGLLMFVVSLAAQDSGMLQLDYTIVQNGTSAHNLAQANVLKRVEFIAPDGRKRTEEINPQSGQVVKATIQIPAQDEVIQIDPQKKTAVIQYGGSLNARSGAPMPGSAFAPIAAQKQDEGTDVIDGFTCHKYRDTVPNQAAIEFSVCNDPASHQTFMGSVEGWGHGAMAAGASPSGQAGWKQTLEKVTRNVPLDKSLFEVPPGYVTSQK